MTKTSVLRSVPPPEQQQQQQRAQKGAAATGDGGGDDDDDDAQSSDDEADEAPGESSGPVRVTCGECCRTFTSEAFFALHAGEKTFRPIKSSNTVEARAVRALKRILDGGSVVVHDRNAGILHVAPPPAAAVGGITDPHAAKFPAGSAKQPQHWQTEGHTCMAECHEVKIREYFAAGKRDKGMKKSPALMVDALQAGAEGHS